MSTSSARLSCRKAGSVSVAASSFYRFRLWLYFIHLTSGLDCSGILGSREAILAIFSSASSFLFDRSQIFDRRVRTLCGDGWPKLA